MHDLILTGWKNLEVNEVDKTVKPSSMFKVWFTYKGLQAGTYTITEQEASEDFIISTNIKPEMFHGKKLKEDKNLNIEDVAMKVVNYQRKGYQVMRRYDDGENEVADKVFGEILGYY